MKSPILSQQEEQIRKAAEEAIAAAEALSSELRPQLQSTVAVLTVTPVGL